MMTEREGRKRPPAFPSTNWVAPREAYRFFVYHISIIRPFGKPRDYPASTPEVSREATDGRSRTDRGSRKT